MLSGVVAAKFGRAGMAGREGYGMGGLVGEQSLRLVGNLVG